GPLVNLTSMAHIVRIDAAELEVEFVKDTVIANSQLEFGSAFKSLVQKTSWSCNHLVQFALDDGRMQEENRMLCRTSATKSAARRPRFIWTGASCIAQPRFRAGTGLAWL